MDVQFNVINNSFPAYCWRVCVVTYSYRALGTIHLYCILYNGEYIICAAARLYLHRVYLIIICLLFPRTSAREFH